MNSGSTRKEEFCGEDTCLDPAVLAELPGGCRFVSAKSHGAGFWKTGRIDVALADGTPQSFFIKVVGNEAGASMVRGEFESMRAIYTLAPDFAPQPLAWGTYQTRPDTYFFLCEFLDMSNKMPAPASISPRLAFVHKASTSPNGKFGFPVQTYAGNLPQMVEWEDSWEVFFSKSLRMALDLEIAAKGPDPELDRLLPVVFDKVIPRLLRPLETDGRSVKPSLVHGDLWFANSGIANRTGNSVVFDACCFYAHNEYEFGQWRPSCNRFGPEYLQEYHKHVEVSEPKEDYDGRLDLYKLRFNTHVSALFFDNLGLREQMLGDIRDLVKRYG